MRGISLFLLLLILLSSPTLTAQQTPFSGENAYSILKTLVQEIGPRPMGSPAEQRALAFAVSKFSEYGCQQSYAMPMTVAKNVNTSSGVAVGVLKGKTDRIIVIGGHIDSAGPDIPGANDDGSGAACVMELARALGTRVHESTIVFCCWGGEEEGLNGSAYFVDHFSSIDSVVLMLQLDMADGSGDLEIDPDGSAVSAPRWLTEAAYEVFYKELGYSGMVYPTHAATLNSALGGATGSDHISFLDKGIPAIDFTSDVTYPIHTPQDNWENFNPSGLKRSGDLVLKLFERFDGGVPSHDTEQYMLVQFGVRPLFLAHWILWFFIGLSVSFGVVALVDARRRIPESTVKVHWSLIKLLLFALIIQTFIWYSENVVGVIRGLRFPWVNNFPGFFALGICFGMIGLWVALRLAKTLRLTQNHYLYARAAFLLMFVCTVLASFRSPELAFYPAAGLFLFSLAMIVRQPLLKLLFILASPYMIFRLFFFESLGLIQRLITMNMISAFWQSALYNIGFVLLFTIVSLPFVYAFAAVYRDSNVDLLWLKRFSGKAGLAGTLVAAMLLTAFLSTRPVYGPQWFSSVRVEQRYTSGSDSSEITLKGSESLNGLIVQADGREIQFPGRTNSYTFLPAQSSIVRWCDIDARNEPAARLESDSTWHVKREVILRSHRRPLWLSVVYSSETPFEISGPWAHGTELRAGRESDRVKVFTWYSFPDSILAIPVTFGIADTQHIVEKIDVRFDSLAYPMHLNREFTNVSMRTTFSARNTFGVRNDSTGLADITR